ncbi:MAG: hypothetical protein AAF197_04815 [Pseudomonadota bacterium]
MGVPFFALMVKSVTDSGSRVLDTVRTQRNARIWNDLSMRFTGSQIEVSLNGTLRSVVTDVDHNSGQAGVKANLCECRFDNLAIDYQ